ncbi:MAG: UvrD-helicase domain-containing protein, partial [Actinobacteria bacterium]|nr:UvrD-helicase domain-containing protein [Actinomycetota bacterium]NIS36958.1 UvrD-helicase domain-containing protein [Actinomycetota bacterium]NIW33378.1 UvrD-helicase domain-containing protein [Actinomycetota bacterium]
GGDEGQVVRARSPGAPAGRGLAVRGRGRRRGRDRRRAMSAPRRPTAAPRELVLASAGSGKTYHLSNRIIMLLAAGAPADEVLSSTFTRKAAGEILDRVLVRIAEGAVDAEKAK